jgi:hypothetical protein
MPEIDADTDGDGNAVKGGDLEFNEKEPAVLLLLKLVSC